MAESHIGLDEAYSLKTPEDNRRLYKKWATSYEAGFVSENGYIYPLQVAAAFMDRADSAARRVLDIGCGTGLVGVGLAELGGPRPDGLDLSPEMLDEAGRKTDSQGRPIYGDLIVGDLTASLSLPDGAYDGIVSAGTFTHGHVGTGRLTSFIELLQTARFSLSGSIRTTTKNGGSRSDSGTTAILGESANRRSVGSRYSRLESTSTIAPSWRASGQRADSQAWSCPAEVSRFHSARGCFTHLVTEWAIAPDLASTGWNADCLSRGTASRT